MNQLSAFGSVLLFITGGLLLSLAGLLTSALLRPNRPNPEKLSTYECGEDPVGASWIQFNMRFYVMGLIFLIFDVEVIFLFPWVKVFGHPELQAADSRWAAYAFAEIFFFTLILVAGLAWVWKNGDLDWIRPDPLITDFNSCIPEEKYAALNEKYSRHSITLPVTEHSPAETEHGITG